MSHGRIVKDGETSSECVSAVELTWSVDKQDDGNDENEIVCEQENAIKRKMKIANKENDSKKQTRQQK